MPNPAQDKYGEKLKKIEEDKLINLKDQIRNLIDSFDQVVTKPTDDHIKQMKTQMQQLSNEITITLNIVNLMNNSELGKLVKLLDIVNNLLQDEDIKKNINISLEKPKKSKTYFFSISSSSQNANTKTTYNNLESLVKFFNKSLSQLAEINKRKKTDGYNEKNRNQYKIKKQNLQSIINNLLCCEDKETSLILNKIRYHRDNNQDDIERLDRILIDLMKIIAETSSASLDKSNFSIDRSSASLKDTAFSILIEISQSYGFMPYNEELLPVPGSLFYREGWSEREKINADSAQLRYLQDHSFS
ncbi:MAG: hypothetical protein EP298_00005 [Gammaproteobacteria bacterium]|nr:MAG: hypothetical protein EP298_00005 [Gammaproteobacteria bacterium]UTW43615.1 hypothetical protein KFE69_05865 [bacterium SCSIO 12844]